MNDIKLHLPIAINVIPFITQREQNYINLWPGTVE